MVQRYISHSISNTLHYSSEIHPYVGEFSYLWLRRRYFAPAKSQINLLLPPAYSYLWLTPKILPLGIIKLTLASALTYSYLCRQ